MIVSIMHGVAKLSHSVGIVEGTRLDLLLFDSSDAHGTSSIVLIAGMS